MSADRLTAFLLSMACILVAFAPGETLPAAVVIERDADLQRLLGEREVVFLARSLDGERVHTLDPARAGERHAPFSTFKIPNFLIALETSTVADPAEPRAWDPAARPARDFWPESWKQPQSLLSAFRRSAVWYFRDIAAAVGGERYRAELQRFAYGNAAAPDGNDAFWLDGTLQISVSEQVAFLAALLRGDFGVADAHMRSLREASLLGLEAGCQLHGKTGAGPVGEDFDGPFEGWLVGWSDCGDGAPTVFALWTSGASFAAIRDFRRSAAVALLRRAGAFHPRRNEA